MSRLLGVQLITLSLLVGLAVPRIGDLLGFSTLLVIVLIALLKSRSGLVLLFIMFSFLTGLFRGNFMWQQLDGYQQHFYQQVEIHGTVLEDGVYGFRRQVEFYIDDIVIDGQELPGKVRVAGFGPIEVNRGDVVQASGQLRPGYGSYQASLGFAEYRVVYSQHNFIEDFRHRFIASTYSLLPEPQASLGLGFLAGFRSLLPDDLTDDLSTTGLTHIVAVSGYNTTIIAAAVQRGLAKRLSRFGVVSLTLALLGVFLAITGQAPSIVRACAVSGLGLSAWYFGRKVRPSVLILVPAAVTAYITPINLWFSLGWWLSFLAFFGVLVVAPLITAKTFKNTPNLLFRTAIETTSAQLMTLPLIIWVFGQVSVVAVIANMLVLPVIPIAMLLTFVVGLAGMIYPALASILAGSATVILVYITDMISLLASLPWALKEISITKAEMLFFYTILAAITWILGRSLKKSVQKLYTLY